ncbi:hypothetical protein [Actinophytocola algeriensis]|uniref:Uncharacterized protein n=1 Tax=Actinophytocola algeriensis TaxID=1768010 RepID=A0A7W7Q1Z2_9PSEU|nr:hypothetical protein [Actinophytocola algeriensis]MBB4905343.1 hypothetical protein [Actinophytocola algeriensis]MBE1472972.1 hypothetical protein [Actinophytocola algeriensis]
MPNRDLADRYRRLLAWYPRDHRERHGEEMLGVLLAGAEDRTRPSRKETADLLLGALRLHLRRTVGMDGGIDHRDVLAIVSLLGPVVLLAGAAPMVDRVLFKLRAGIGLSRWDLVENPAGPAWAIWCVVAVLCAFRMRRAAAVGAWLGTAGFVVAAVYAMGWFWASVVFYAAWLLLGAVVAVALTWSPGPARGWELVGGRRFAVLVAAVAVSAVLVVTSLGQYGLLFFPLELVTFVQGNGGLARWFLGLAALVAGALVAAGARTREGRRAALVLSVPALVSVLMLMVPMYSRLMLQMAVCYGVPVVVLLALGGLPRRVRTGRQA